MTDPRWIQSALREYERPLLRYALSLLGDLERARDAVQDTFLRLCRQDPESVKNHLAPWLFRVCRNRAIELRRKVKRMQPLEAIDLDTLAADTPQPVEVLETRETLSQVLELLQTFPANQQEVIRLKFQHGLSYKQISSVTGLSVSNVGFLLHTALKRLREKMYSSEEPAAIRRIK